MLQVQSLFVDAFLHNNRLEHMVQVMGYHPKYLESFLKAQDTMLRGDGPLPYDYRHYIAIMVGVLICDYICFLLLSLTQINWSKEGNFEIDNLKVH